MNIAQTLAEYIWDQQWHDTQKRISAMKRKESADYYDLLDAIQPADLSFDDLARSDGPVFDAYVIRNGKVTRYPHHGIRRSLVAVIDQLGARPGNILAVWQPWDSGTSPSQRRWTRSGTAHCWIVTRFTGLIRYSPLNVSRRATAAASTWCGT